MDNTSSPEAPVANQSRVWVGPLIAGCCFALGYGITQRVLTLQTNAQDPVPEAFTSLAFPGESLQKMRARFKADDASLQVDVMALEAAEAANRPAKPVPPKLIKTTAKPALALQTPKPPVWQAPAWSDPQTTAPTVQPERPTADESAPTPTQEATDGQIEPEPLVLPEPSEAAPAAVMPADDSPVLVAEPVPVAVPPGAEAFFEAVEPLTPPQP